MQSFNKHNFSKDNQRNNFLYLSKHAKQDHSLLNEKIIFSFKTSNVTLKANVAKEIVDIFLSSEKHIKLI